MKVIRFYKTNEIPYGVFSNFSAHPIFWDGRKFGSSEFFYQAHKFYGYGHGRLDQIARASNPSKAYKIGNSHPTELRADWEQGGKEWFMRQALYAKFTQHPELKELLLGTGDALLIEATSYDVYWGEGRDSEGNILDGCNRLGFLLMELRAFFQNTTFREAGCDERVYEYFSHEQGNVDVDFGLSPTSGESLFNLESDVFSRSPRNPIRLAKWLSLNLDKGITKEADNLVAEFVSTGVCHALLPSDFVDLLEFCTHHDRLDPVYELLEGWCLSVPAPFDPRKLAHPLIRSSMSQCIGVDSAIGSNLSQLSVRQIICFCFYAELLEVAEKSSKGYVKELSKHFNTFQQYYCLPGELSQFIKHVLTNFKPDKWGFDLMSDTKRAVVFGKLFPNRLSSYHEESQLVWEVLYYLHSDLRLSDYKPNLV